MNIYLKLHKRRTCMPHWTRDQYWGIGEMTSPCPMLPRLHFESFMVPSITILALSNISCLLSAIQHTVSAVSYQKSQQDWISPHSVRLSCACRMSLLPILGPICHVGQHVGDKSPNAGPTFGNIAPFWALTMSCCFGQLPKCWLHIRSRN